MAAATGRARERGMTHDRRHAAAAEPPPSAAGAPRRLLDRVLRIRELAILVVLAVMLVATQLDNTSFLSEQGIKDLLLNATILVLVAVGEAMVVITRNVDLSVGSVLGRHRLRRRRSVAARRQSGAGVVLWRSRSAPASARSTGCWSASARCRRWWSRWGRSTSSAALDSIWVGSRQITASRSAQSVTRSFGHNGLSAIPYLAMLAAVVLVAVGYFLRNYRSGREMLRARLARAGRGVGRRAGAAARHGRVRGVRRARRPGRSALSGPLLLRRRRDRQRLRADRGLGRGGRRRRLHRRFGQRLRRGARSALLLTSINSVLPAIGVSSVWVEAIDGVLLLLAISVDRIVALRVAGLLRSRARQARMRIDG